MYTYTPYCNKTVGSEHLDRSLAFPPLPPRSPSLSPSHTNPWGVLYPRLRKGPPAFVCPTLLLTTIAVTTTTTTTTTPLSASDLRVCPLLAASSTNISQLLSAGGTQTRWNGCANYCFSLVGSQPGRGPRQTPAATSATSLGCAPDDHFLNLIHVVVALIRPTRLAIFSPLHHLSFFSHRDSAVVASLDCFGLPCSQSVRLAGARVDFARVLHRYRPTPLVHSIASIHVHLQKFPTQPPHLNCRMTTVALFARPQY